VADSFTAYLNLRKPEVGAALDNWGSVPGLNGDMDLIDAVFAPGGDGTSVGVNIGTGKIGNASGGTLLVTADRFQMWDATDPTKSARLIVNAVPTATEVDYFLPPATDILVGLTQPQHFAAKTTDDPPGGIIDVTQAVASAKWVQDTISAAITLAIATLPSQFNTGDIVASAAVAKTGWAKLTGTTIGNTGSGAALADPAARNLFNLFWAINGFTWPIGGGRGGTADADWTALKTIALPDASGMALIGIGGTINIATLFATFGEAKHLLTVAEMPSHAHAISPPLERSVNGGGGVSGGGQVMQSIGTVLGTTAAAGGDTPHNIVQPSMGVVYWMKL